MLVATAGKYSNLHLLRTVLPRYLFNVQIILPIIQQYNVVVSSCLYTVQYLNIAMTVVSHI
jgi:hypothetical protein